MKNSIFQETARSPLPFEIRWQSRFGSWAQDLGILFSRAPSVSAGVWPFRSLTKSSALKPVRGVFVSVLVHAAAFALITHMDFTPGYQPRNNVDVADATPIYIDMQALKELHILRAVPVVRPPGPGGQPGSAEKRVEVILQASSAQHPKLTIVLKPLKADNERQAVNQKLSPPDLKLQLEQKVPDILLADNAAAAKPQVDMRLRQPLAPKLQNQKIDAPAITADAPGAPFKADNPSIARPGVDMRLHQPVAPEFSQNQSADPAPMIASNGTALAFKIAPTVRQPQLPVGYLSGSMGAPRGAGSPNGRPGTAGGVGGTGNSNGADGGASGDPSGGVVVVSLSPAEFSKLASLAQGNRYGQLAIAPSKEGAGSPGGSPNGTAGGGSGGPGRGGDGSVGVGAGHSGGGGGGVEGPNKATFSAVGGVGRSGGVDANRLLSPVLPATVYAVPIPASRLRRPPLVVATGPIGGGGLDAYNALSCGKVYTIFMPMPGRSWVLQYCAHPGADGKAAQPATASAGVLQMEVGLVPPTADQEYDFRRLTIPDKDADKMIVLRGSIDKDGAISDVHVYQGVLPEMDSEAALAFSNWKFRPATRAGVPVGVDVLVGIPARLPEKLNASTTAAPSNQN